MLFRSRFHLVPFDYFFTSSFNTKCPYRSQPILGDVYETAFDDAFLTFFSAPIFRAMFVGPSLSHNAGREGWGCPPFHHTNGEVFHHVPGKRNGPEDTVYDEERPVSNSFNS